MLMLTCCDDVKQYMTYLVMTYDCCSIVLPPTPFTPHQNHYQVLIDSAKSLNSDCAAPSSSILHI